MADNKTKGTGTATATAPDTKEPKGSALYEVLKGIDFERRQLVGKKQGQRPHRVGEEQGGRTIAATPAPSASAPAPWTA